MKRLQILSIIFFVLFFAFDAMAHFGMIIPSDSMVMQKDNIRINLDISFSHPFEGVGMNMEKPKNFNLAFRSKTKNLLSSLKSTDIMGKRGWKLDYKIKRPGAYTFYMEPTPYFEPAEDCFIIHYTKTIVAAFGSDEGWDEEIGLKTEIVPLSKPFGLYTGNIFSGIVKLDGKPVPYAEVEVEYYNMDGKAKAPSEYMITQTIKADKNGVFVYSAPKGGWWGFAALNTADYKLRHKDKEKDVEIGAVIWVKFHDWQTKN